MLSSSGGRRLESRRRSLRRRLIKPRIKIQPIRKSFAYR